MRDGVIELSHVDTNDQLADMMTKAQLKHTFIEHTDRILNGTCTPRDSSPQKGKRMLVFVIVCRVLWVALCVRSLSGSILFFQLILSGDFVRMIHSLMEL